MSFKLVGNLYVDKVFGSDTTGTGSRETPYFTAQKAATEAAPNDIIILGPGLYEEVISINSNKALKVIGDGLVIFSGLNITGVSFGPLSGFAHIENINFSNYIGANVCLWHNVLAYGPKARVLNCRFEYCNFRINTGWHNDDPAFAAINIKHCIFRHCYIIPNGIVQATTGELQNNTFDTCEGRLAQLFIGGRAINNLFRNCYNLTVAPIPVQQPAGAEFDYNQIEGMLQGWTLAQWRANVPWSNGNSFSLQNAEYLNDISDTRNDLNTWRNDYTLSPYLADGTTRNPLITGGKFGRFIGAMPRGFKFSAGYIWANKANSNNLVYDAGSNTLKLDPAPGPMVGVIETNTLPISDGGDEPIVLDVLRLFQNIIWSTTAPGRAAQLIDTTPETAPNSLLNQKTVYEIEAAFYTDNSNPTVWQKFEINSPTRQDAAGKGYGDPDFNPAQQQLITANFVRFKITFRRV